MSSADPALDLVRRYARHRRGTPLVWSLAAALSARVCLTADTRGWWDHAFPSALGAMGLSFILLTVWFWRDRSNHSRLTARALDERWGLRSRLEASVEGSRENTAWAAALRADAAHATSGRSAPGAFLWKLGFFALCASLLAVTVQLAILAQIFLGSRPEEPEVVSNFSPSGNSDLQVKELAAGVTFEWKKPESDIQAGAVDEVPLTIVVHTPKGLHNAALEINVNGERTRKQELPAEALRSLGLPGSHELELSLYLDELQVEPYDIVSYRLVGEPNVGAQGTLAKSTPQLVQIRQAQKDIAVEGGDSEMVTLLYQIKSRQLFLLKETAAMSQAAVAGDRDAVWQKSNQQLAEDQGAVADETLGFRTLAMQRANRLLAARLSPAEIEMRDAAQLVGSGENEAALTAQQRALSVLTALEAHIRRSLRADGSKNPIEDEQKVAAPSDAEPVALLAADQRNWLRRDDLGFASSDAIAEQARIAAAARALSQATEYAQAVQAALAGAAGHASQAAEQLTQHDPAAARLEGRGALRALEEALHRMKNGSGTDAVENSGGLAKEQKELLARRYNPADVPPAYRAAVEAYFERLSRDVSSVER